MEIGQLPIGFNNEIPTPTELKSIWEDSHSRPAVGAMFRVDKIIIYDYLIPAVLLNLDCKLLSSKIWM